MFHIKIPEKDHPLWEYVPRAWRTVSILCILLLTASNPDETEVRAWLIYMLAGEGPTALMRRK